jgi:hypothetical protein
MKLLFAVCFFSFYSGFTQSGQSIQAEFIVLRNEQEVGTLMVNQMQDGITTTYTLTSTVRIQALLTLHIRESIVNEFENDVLISSIHTREINDFNSIDRVVIRSGDQYVCKDETLTHLDSPITFSIVSLYFQEPRNRKEIYSESFREIISLDLIKPGSYSLRLPNQNITAYHYENGILMRVEAHTKWGLVTFQRVTPMASR